MELAPLLLMLTTLHSTLSRYCPCDISPSLCDVNCCCDASCSVSEIKSFTCPTYLLSDTKLCCKDKLSLSSTGVYTQTKHCSTNLVCLNEVPSAFQLYKNNTNTKPDNNFISTVTSDHIKININTNTEQYTDKDMLLHSKQSKIIPFLFPVSLMGETCISSPVNFYTDKYSSCTRSSIISVTELCKPGTILDFGYYLSKALLTYPHTNATSFIKMTDNTRVKIYCMDPITKTKSVCTGNTPRKSPKKCINVVKEVHIKLMTGKDKMVLAGSLTEVILTSLNVLSTTFNQQFSLRYVPVLGIRTDEISGNFGYTLHSDMLSGRVEKKSVKMDVRPNMRPMSLFTSSNGDCSDVERVSLKFGVNQYTGCKLSLPWYNFGLMSKADDKIPYCKTLQNTISRIMVESSADSRPIVIGTVGNASVADVKQWVYVTTEPLSPPDDVSTGGVMCNDVITHRTYKVYYTEVGEANNLQSVITHVRVELSRQNVVLYCGSDYCTPPKQQYIVISNSVQYKYNKPSTKKLYKANTSPGSAILLPHDFFYPLSSRTTVLSYNMLMFSVVFLLDLR